MAMAELFFSANSCVAWQNTTLSLPFPHNQLNIVFELNKLLCILSCQEPSSIFPIIVVRGVHVSACLENIDLQLQRIII